MIFARWQKYIDKRFFLVNGGATATYFYGKQLL